MSGPDYRYRAKLVRVIDGDTIVVDIDLGLRTWRHDEHLRLIGVNAPERYTEEGVLVKVVLIASLDSATELVVETHKDATGKYGRWLADATWRDRDGEYRRWSQVIRAAMDGLVA